MPHAAFYWQAYCAITRPRVWIEGRPLAIPLAEIDAYVRLHAVPPDMVDVLLYVIDVLEGVYFTWYEREAKKQKGKKRLPKK